MMHLLHYVRRIRLLPRSRLISMELPKRTGALLISTDTSLERALATARSGQAIAIKVAHRHGTRITAGIETAALIRQ